MALEPGDYINDLVITNPTATDPKSAGDDHFRLIKKVLKECLNGFAGAILLTATDTGTASAHVLTPTTALVGYTYGLMLLYRPANAGTGALTVNVSALGAKSVKTIAGADPTSGDVLANQPLLLMYDGTNFVILAGSEFLSKTGNQTLTGNLTLTGNQTISGTLGVTGNTSITGTLAAGATTVTGALSVSAGGSFGATITGVTESAGDSSTKLASTAFAMTMQSPAFTGTPTAPTAATGTNTTQLATTAFVNQTAFSALLPAQPGGAQPYELTSTASVAAWSVRSAGASLYMANNFGAF